jgi:hypothetical protein
MHGQVNVKFFKTVVIIRTIYFSKTFCSLHTDCTYVISEIILNYAKSLSVLQQPISITVTYWLHILGEIGTVYSETHTQYTVKYPYHCVSNVTSHAQKPDFVFQRNGRVH